MEETEAAEDTVGSPECSRMRSGCREGSQECMMVGHGWMISGRRCCAPRLTKGKGRHGDGRKGLLAGAHGGATVA